MTIALFCSVAAMRTDLYDQPKFSLHIPRNIQYIVVFLSTTSSQNTVVSIYEIKYFKDVAFMTIFIVCLITNSIIWQQSSSKMPFSCSKRSNRQRVLCETSPMITIRCSVRCVCTECGPDYCLGLYCTYGRAHDDNGCPLCDCFQPCEVRLHTMFVQNSVYKL